jgi:hypothetical protein
MIVMGEKYYKLQVYDARRNKIQQTNSFNETTHYFVGEKGLECAKEEFASYCNDYKRHCEIGIDTEKETRTITFYLKECKLNDRGRIVDFAPSRILEMKEYRNGVEIV